MRIFKKTNVYDEALNRIRWVFDEFDNVVVGISGGKDSTVIFNLALKVAREKKRLPLNVFFLDQEIEWQATIDQVKRIMYNPDVKPLWYQVEFKLFNATSVIEHWLYCWDKNRPGDWMREKDKVAIKEKDFTEDRFAGMFTAIIKSLYPNQKACYLAGVRMEESPGRKMGLSGHLCYKDITWGKILDNKVGQYTLYPIYDWSYLDTWKAILDNGWPYNKIYDMQYKYGVKINDMRVSNLHHETAVHSLFYLQELEPETYDKAVARISGLDMAGKMGKEDFFVKELPFMFKDWVEYRDYLLEKLITNPKWNAGFKSRFNRMDIKYEGMVNIERMYHMQVNSILTNDWEFIKIDNWEHRPEVNFYYKWKRDGTLPYGDNMRVNIPKDKW